MKMTRYQVKECYRQEKNQLAADELPNVIRAKSLESAKRRMVADKQFDKTILVIASQSGSVLSVFRTGMWADR
jgi:hypothetical protein